MTEASTLFLLHELETRLGSSLDEQEPRFDLILTRMPVNDTMVLYNTLSEYTNQYKQGVENGVY